VVASQSLVVQGEPTAGVTEALVRRSAPYLWSYPPTLDTTLHNFGAMICTSLPAQGRAQYAQGDTAARERKFALGWFHADGSRDPDNNPLLTQLASCGVHPKVFSLPFRGESEELAAAAAMQQLRADGYTSLIWRGGSNHTSAALIAARAAGYKPEWLLPGDPTQNEEVMYQSTGDPVAILGVAWWNKAVPHVPPPSQLALQGGPGSNSPSLYAALQLIASGIQAAGPHLTPQTFSAGLQGLRFPNPGAGASPSWQARVDYREGHAGVTDFAAWWWDPNKPGPSNGSVGGTGGFCYVYRGARWSLHTSWPTTPLPFYPTSRQCN
jgi:hypothetical protein